ncbi:MAG: 2-hydroxyacyl-CoA dehydratase family protein [Armatimonadota bacterium]|jgi:benzoyl-CoA reductase/2-hydroxyglutaryl-CoA dehydratase subunit BcrC/BadD/HgdB
MAREAVGEVVSGAIEYFREIITTGRRQAEVEAFPGKVVGVYCNFVPEALLCALGALPVRLCSGNREAARRGEELFARDTCSLVKSCVGNAIAGEGLFPRLDLLVIPTSCDAKTKLGAVLAAFKPVHVLQLPRTKSTRAAASFWIGEVWELARRLETLTGHKLTREALEEEIVLLNRRQQVFRRFLELRKRVPSLVTGEEALLVTGASFSDDPGRWTAHCEQLCAEREAAVNRSSERKLRLLLTGAPLIHPHLKLVQIIEQAGAEITIDELCSGTQRLYDPVVFRDRSLRAMVESVAEKHLLPSTCPCFAQQIDRMNRVQELASEFRVDGVVYHCLRVCPAFDIESMSMQRGLKQQGLPCLTITTDYGQEDTEQIRNRVQAFLEMLGARTALGAGRS